MISRFISKNLPGAYRLVSSGEKWVHYIISHRASANNSICANRNFFDCWNCFDSGTNYDAGSYDSST
mgnify:CR=1 FL=1